jgi:hypothetical protein
MLSCNKKTIPADTLDLGKDYYPSKLGKYIVYDVDSIVYDEFTFDTTYYKYRIKEKLEEEFTDNENKPALKLVRYMKRFNPVKSYDSIAWTIKDIWQVNVNNTNVEVVEENVRFTKLIFPVKKGAIWDGNVRNTLGEWEYSYDYINNNESINGVSCANTLMVSQKDFRTLISWQNYAEKYAKGIGLVYREIIDIKHPVTSTVTPIENIPNKQGIIYKQKIVTYGYE